MNYRWMLEANRTAFKFAVHIRKKVLNRCTFVIIYLSFWLYCHTIIYFVQETDSFSFFLNLAYSASRLCHGMKPCVPHFQHDSVACSMDRCRVVCPLHSRKIHYWYDENLLYPLYVYCWPIIINYMSCLFDGLIVWP